MSWFIVPVLVTINTVKERVNIQEFRKYSNKSFSFSVINKQVFLEVIILFIETFCHVTEEKWYCAC